MRLALLALTVSCLSYGTVAYATDSMTDKSVNGLEIQLDAKEVEYKNFISSLNELNLNVTEEQEQLRLFLNYKEQEIQHCLI